MGLRSGTVLGTLHTPRHVAQNKREQKERVSGKRISEWVNEEREKLHQAILCDKYYKL